MRHRHGRAHEDHTKPTLPITAFLDFSFQLLAFFIITFKPSTTEGQLSLKLPKAGADQTLAAPPPTGLTDEPEELYVVRASGDRSGNLTGLELVVPKVADPIKYDADSTKLRDDLKGRVEAKRAAGEPVPKLEYQFADTLNMQFVMKQLDEAKQAGFETISPTLLAAEKPKPAAK